jgi:beta-phosphoglucomutase
MDKPAPCSALILDMDGLLLDTEVTYTHAWKNAARSLGHHLQEGFWNSLAGLHYQDVEARLAAACGDLDFARFRVLSGDYWRSHVAEYGITLKNGFGELFDALAATALPYCLATNSRERNADECLRLAGVGGLFPLRLTRDHVTEGKPAPEIFLKAAAQLNTDIEQCWAIEDSYTGIAAAKSAGAFAVWIPTPQYDSRAGQAADLILGDLAELADILRKQFALANCDQL